MIQPLQSNLNINFRATKERQVASMSNSQNRNSSTTNSTKIDFKETAQKIYQKGSKIYNRINNILSPILSPIKAPIQGAGAIIGAGILGKNIKNSKGSIPKAIKGSIADITKGSLSLIKSIPNILTKSPIQNIKNILLAPVKFYSKYLKAHKTTAVTASLIGVGIMGRKHIAKGIRAIKENIKAKNKPEIKKEANKAENQQENIKK